MRGRAFLTSVAMAAAAVMVSARPQSQTQPAQTFRTGTDVVVVDVSVRDGQRPVTGLTADRFVLTDNGVRQRIETVDATSVPIDLSLVIDVSGNPRSPWADRTPRSTVVSRLETELAEVARLLRPEDRLRVFAVDRGVQLVSPLAAPASRPALRPFDFDGLPALYDSLAAALMQPGETARRHVVIAKTKGQDGISSVDAAAVRAIAERSDALFHLVTMETALDNHSALSAFQCQMIGYCWPTRRFWVPFSRRLLGPRPVHALLPDGVALQAGAMATGGDLHKTQMFAEPSVERTFRQVMEEFRSGYVLRYSPAGVGRPGWHTIEVKVPGFRYTVRSRPGYGVEEPVASNTPVKVPAVPRTLSELVAAFEGGRYQQVVDGIRQQQNPFQLLREFDGAGNPWPATPRREAAFALELAQAGLFSSDKRTREQAQDLLERFSALVRHPLQPDTFEGYWHFAALTMLEGAVRPKVARAFVDRALERFPHEARFLLSRAIVFEQRHAAGGGGEDPDDGGNAPDPDTIIRAYRAAIQFRDTSAEAQIRLGAFLHRIGRQEDALEHLNAAAGATAEDPYLKYLRLLVTGHTFDALGRRADAIAAYRSALDVAPSAQSARVSLMNTLLISGDREGAEALAEKIQTEPEPVDPWWLYWQGQFRLHAQAMARVRELSR